MKKVLIFSTAFCLLCSLASCRSTAGNVRTDSAAALPVISSTEGLEGVWEDPETNDLHTIEKTSGGFEVTSVVEQSGESVSESMEIRSSVWQDGVLSWSYFVPSTGFLVYFKTVRLDGNTLEIEWTNKDSAGVTKTGKEILERYVKSGSDSEDSDTDSADDDVSEAE